MGLCSPTKVGQVTQNTYTGTDNLEVMEEAINYNRFLMSLVLDANRERRPMLDFGAGVGTFAKAFAESGLKVDCVEPDQGQAELIKQSALHVVESIDRIPSEQYDFIYSFNVLEHIPNDRQALEDLYRIMRPGGRILIYVPAYQLLYSSMDRKVGHVRRYHRAELLEKLSTAKFAVDRARHADCLGFVASLMFKWSGNNSGQIDRRAVRLYDRFAFPVSRLLDGLLSRWIGKNLIVLATKPVSLSANR